MAIRPLVILESKQTADHDLYKFCNLTSWFRIRCAWLEVEMVDVPNALYQLEPSVDQVP